MGFLAWLNPIGAILKDMTAAYTAHENAQTDQERILWDARIKTLEARLSQTKAAMAYRAFWVAWLAFTLPLAFYFGKSVAWDSALGLGHTPHLEGETLEWARLIIANVFPSGAAVGIGQGLSQAAIAIFGRK
jgi:hypothetical protein